MSEIVCAFCQRQASGGCFEITRFDAAGQNRGSVKVCSALCLVQWSYGYAINSGVRMVQSAKGIFDRISEMLRGPADPGPGPGPGPGGG